MRLSILWRIIEIEEGTAEADNTPRDLYSWVARDVTKNQTKKQSIRLCF